MYLIFVVACKPQEFIEMDFLSCVSAHQPLAWPLLNAPAQVDHLESKLLRFGKSPVFNPLILIKDKVPSNHCGKMAP